MIESGKDKDNEENVIELSDKGFETAMILRLVLRIMFTTENISDFTSQLHRPIIRFMDKYELQSELQAIRGSIALKLAVPSGDEEVYDLPIMFDLACWLGDWDLCGAILKRSLAYDGSVVVDEKRNCQVLEAGGVLNPAFMSLARYESLPTRVVWALSRASRKLHDGPKNFRCVDDVAREFVCLMKMKGEFGARSSGSRLTSLGDPGGL